MQTLLEREIDAEAKRRLAKFSRERHFVAKYRKVFTKRTGITALTTPKHTPPSWDFHRHFDPRYCKKHAAFLAQGIWKSLREGTYKPVRTLRVHIEKASGGTRCLDTFSVPDAAVARIFFRNLRARNEKIFSDSSFAYRSDKTTLDAIIKIKSSLLGNPKFVSQYDFARYFESISHEYLGKSLEKDGPFLTTAMERHVLKAVMAHEFSDTEGEEGTRAAGIPQGNSLSLFLANVAAHDLDQKLGRLNGSFARFADDSIVLNNSYEDALRCADAYHEFSKESGVLIHPDKSTGIRILSDQKAEMQRISEFNFLSYRFNKDGLGVSEKAINSIKRRCIRIIYNNLILHVRRTDSISAARLGTKFRDWDLVTCINELRSYIYGGKRQCVMDDYLNGNINVNNVSGAVSYFALVKNGEVFRELDGWLLDMVERAYNYRVELINSIRKKQIKTIPRSKIISGSWYRFTTIEMETRLPSFFTAWRTARKSWFQHGLGGIDSQGSGYAYE